MLLAFTTLTLNAQNSVEKVTKSITNVVDSAKTATVNGINFVDTSSTFKNIYKDVKSGITGLAEGLKVGAEHVYIILVKQQVVKAVSWLIYFILLILLGFILYELGVKLFSYCDEDNPALFLYSVFIGGGYLALVIVGILNLDVIVSGIINPEYGAIMDIINFVKH